LNEAAVCTQGPEALEVQLIVTLDAPASVEPAPVRPLLPAFQRCVCPAPTVSVGEPALQVVVSITSSSVTLVQDRVIAVPVPLADCVLLNVVVVSEPVTLIELPIT
jgi:hypothetical protein